jgi:hypothetical protein
MLTETQVHAWSPVIWALQSPQYFYPILGGLFVIAALIWWCAPYFLARRAFQRQAAEASLRTALTLFYTGSVVALGIVGAVIQFQANLERDFNQQQHTLSADNAKRFNEAVTHLKSAGSPLETLSAVTTFSDLINQNGFYWPTVAEVLVFLRLAVQQGGDVNRPEIANALQLLSSRDWNKQGTEPFPLDLSDLDLHNLKFSSLQLWGTDFQNTNLSNAILPGAKLERSGLIMCELAKRTFRDELIISANHAL